MLVHYHGTYVNGEVFDSSMDRGKACAGEKIVGRTSDRRVKSSRVIQWLHIAFSSSSFFFPLSLCLSLSFSSGEAIKFPSNQVIKGWQEGLRLMSAGSKATMVIPSDLAYGDTGTYMHTHMHALAWPSLCCHTMLYYAVLPCIAYIVYIA